MRQVNLVPNIITTFGLACGLFVIFHVNMKQAGTYDLLYISSLVLLLAALADVLDGAIARVIKAESEFGLIFDSLADGITFGVAPSILFIKALNLSLSTPLSFFALIAALLYTLCGVLRLVRFSVNRHDLVQKSFTGLPIPAAAAAAVSVNLFLFSSYETAFFAWSLQTKAIVLGVFMVTLSLLMVSRLKFPSLKTVHTRVPPFNLLLGGVIIAICLLYGILYVFPLLFAGVSLAYILLGLLLSFMRLCVSKRSSFLKDFDPTDRD